MGLENLDPNRTFEKIIDTAPQNRSWVLSVIINIIFGVWLGIMYYSYDKANNERIAAERSLNIQLQANLKDNKDYSKAILEAEKECRKEYELKIEILKSKYEQTLVEKAASLERDMRILRNEARRINNNTKEITKKVGL